MAKASASLPLATHAHAALWHMAARAHHHICSLRLHRGGISVCLRNNRHEKTLASLLRMKKRKIAAKGKKKIERKKAKSSKENGEIIERRLKMKENENEENDVKKKKAKMKERRKERRKKAAK